MFKLPVTARVLYPLDMRDCTSLIAVVQDHLRSFPELTPEFWGQVEPTEKFNPDHIARLATRPDDFSRPNDSGDNTCAVGRSCDSIYWTRKSQPKAWGSFGPRWGSGDRATHSNVTLTCEMGELRQDILTQYLTHFSIGLDADFGYIQSAIPQYKDLGIANGAAQFGGDVSFTTHILRHWLPDVFWGTLFGTPYIELLGRQKILSTPSVKIHEISGDLIYVQLTETLDDVATNPHFFLKAQDAFKRHFEQGIFYDPSGGETCNDVLLRGHSLLKYQTPDFVLT